MHPNDSVEHFAEISALLDDPFADRQAVLRAAGLDEERWSRIVEHWSARLATAEGEALAERFGDVYAAARRRHVEPTPLDSTAPRFLSTTAQPWRAEAASVGIEVSQAPPSLAAAPPAPGTAAPRAQASAPEPMGSSSLAGTTDVDWRTIRAPLPFGPPPPSGVRLPPAAPPAPPLFGDLGGTLPVGARLPVRVLPFRGAENRPRGPDADAVTPPSEPRK